MNNLECYAIEFRETQLPGKSPNDPAIQPQKQKELQVSTQVSLEKTM
jgi:hypothetical protein